MQKAHVALAVGFESDGTPVAFEPNHISMARQPTATSQAMKGLQKLSQRDPNQMALEDPKEGYEKGPKSKEGQGP